MNDTEPTSDKSKSIDKDLAGLKAIGLTSSAEIRRLTKPLLRYGATLRAMSQRTRQLRNETSVQSIARRARESCKTQYASTAFDRWRLGIPERRDATNAG
jgi:hypothetical protein